MGNEIFKPIEGFKDYEISNYGNVKSLKYGKEIILKNHLNNKGYYHISLCKYGKKYVKKIHYLVAKTFIPNPNYFQEVNHKDENKLNNFVCVNKDGSIDLEKSNLEWCTHKYNINYGTRNERQSAKLKGRIFSEETKRKISEKLKGKPNVSSSKAIVAVKGGEVVMEFASINEASRNGFNQGSVSTACRNCYSTHKGNFYKDYHWYFKSDWEQMQQATQSNERVACGNLEL